MGSRQLNGIPFFASANIQKVNFFSARKSFSQVTRLDLNRRIGVMAGDDMFDYFIDIKIIISQTDICESLIQRKATTAATADVILAKKRALSPRKLLQQGTHSNSWID